MWPGCLGSSVWNALTVSRPSRSLWNVVLKSLWRRQPRAAQASGSPKRDAGFSLIASLNYTCEHHLERLQKLLELRYGERFDFHQELGLKKLIRFASKLQEQDIQRELLLFYLNCPPAVQNFLRSTDVLDEAHYLKNTSLPKRD